MELLTYQFPANNYIKKPVHVGVVGSGDLEVIIKPTDKNESNIRVRTGVKGYTKIWNELIERFFNEHSISADIQINDFGATPGVVKLRLSQAIEVSKSD